MQTLVVHTADEAPGAELLEQVEQSAQRLDRVARSLLSVRLVLDAHSRNAAALGRAELLARTAAADLRRIRGEQR